jgi:predicted nucleic acid-binding protein
MRKAVSKAYYDSAYLFKLQCVEHGTVEVRVHASSVHSLFSAVHARAEFVSTCHRKIREGHGTPLQLRAMLDQFRLDCRERAITLLPLNDSVFERVDSFYLSAPSDLRLRAADALHLACAAEHGFKEVYSNDRNFLAAATHFGLKGINVIGTPAS